MQFQASDYSICNPCGELHGVARSNPATVRRGDVGDTVMTLQDALKKAGFSSMLSSRKWNYGEFDANTESFVESFQKSKGLSVDGIVGPNTWGALGYGTAASRVADVREYVSDVASSTAAVVAPGADPSSEPIHKKVWFVPALVGVAFLLVGTAVIILKD